MFSLNKNSPNPGSKQSSSDSLVIDPSASTSDLWASNTADTSSYADVPSPNQQPGPNPERRGSLFNLRNRSNTSTSTSSFAQPLASPNMATPDNTSHRLSGQSFMEINGGKRSLFRGKKGKRLSGSFSASMKSSEIEEIDTGDKRTSVLRKSRKSSNASELSLKNLKHRISSPFDFQHLTHTDRHQASALQQASTKNDLVAEYWAVHSSQTPRRDLTGLQTGNLHYGNLSAESIPTTRSLSTSSLALTASPVSPGVPFEQQSSQRTEQPAVRPPLRSTRSVDSFSRPGIVHRHTQSAVAPPPRVSSRAPITPMNDLAEDPMETLTVASRRQSGVWDHFVPISPRSPNAPLPTMAEESDYVGHALTTPDNSAIITPPFSPGLDDVAEEPERFISPRPAPRPPGKGPKSPNLPSFDSFSFSNQRSPITKTHARKPSHPSPKSSSQRNSMTRPLSQGSDTLGAPAPSRKNSVRRAPSSRRKSNTWRVIEESWEDDIDYIYDNALEADCDREWDRNSFDGTSKDRDPTPEQQDLQTSAVSFRANTTPALEEEPATRNGHETQRPTLVVPSTSQVPELESRSAVSASTVDTRVQTPSDFFNPLAPPSFAATEAEGFSLTPSLLVPQDFKEELSREDIYNDILADYEGSDRHFPLLESSRSIASSTRSSHIRYSKRSSCDSSLMSSGHGSGSGSWSAGIRRSASSSGSLPELVHSSRHARRDFNAVVDRLSEQVASFNSFNEDEDENEDDTTPPGPNSQQRTFFAEEDEQADVDDYRRGSVEADVMNSLELARRGSARSIHAPAPHHKYSSSDGAGKMLMSASQTAPEQQSPSKPRQRTASSSNAKPQYFSLFPAPPRHSPHATPISPLSPNNL
ncbi:hypothetical protein P280DRAFT_96352 [Massarina eburnea CBS 473.64]|uniref:CRIB domain-containing protein n=1 Tax=Massarina eburnea CBS 473.64 TaxID=1395130 RepID=A0A6A6RRN3_9PLEO|nr:hypothetical protein P280DRAFT_96352 [Massarina eburnea CBS 473.64]